MSSEEDIETFKTEVNIAEKEKEEPKEEIKIKWRSKKFEHSFDLARILDIHLDQNTLKQVFEFILDHLDKLQGQRTA